MMPTQYRQVYLVFLSLLFPILLWGQGTPIIKITEAASLQLIGNQVGVYEDPSSNLLFQDILGNASIFKVQEQETVNYGYTSSAIWIKANIENQTDEPIYIQVMAPSIDTITFYAVADNGEFIQLVSGHDLPFESRDLNISLPSFKIPKKYATVFIRAKSTESMQLPIRLGTASAIISATHQYDLLNGLLIGVVLFMLLYSFLTWLMTKEALYFYYLPLLLVVGFSMIRVNGYGLWMIPFLKHAWNVVVPLFSMLSVPFYLKFLEIKKESHKKLYWMFIILYSVYGVVALVHIAGFAQLSFILLSTSVLIIMPITLFAAVWVYIKGHKPAIYFVFAYIFLLGGVALAILSSVGIIKYSSLTANAFSIGSALQVVLFTLAIADKVNRYKLQAESVQKQALQQAALHSAELEAKVKARTEALSHLNEGLQASEEELRQNLEELQATQEALEITTMNMSAKEEQLRLIFNGVPAMIYQFLLAPDGKISFPIVSKGSEAVYGISPEEIMADASSIMARIHPDDAERFQNSVAISAQTMSVWHEELRSNVDGEYIWVEGSSKPEKLENGSILWSGMIMDITERKKAEYEVTQRQQELEFINEHITSSMEQAQNALEEVNKQKQLVDKKNSDIMASMNYAKRIQQAMLPSDATMQSYLPNSFVFFLPRDVVSGDFYWIHDTETHFYVASIDCTGHGVPGALMSLIGNALLREAIINREIIEPNDILEIMHIGIVKRLQQHENQSKDGMEGAVCVVDKVNKVLKFAGSRTPLNYFKEGRLHTIKGDRASIGMQKKMNDKRFTTHEISLDSPVRCYLYSDGYQDQFGEVTGRKFMSSRLKQLLIDLQPLSFENQAQKVSHEFFQWKGAEKQTDDVMLLGFEIDVEKMI